MLECLTEWMMPPLYTWHGTGRIPPRCGVRHNMIVPYGAYRAPMGVNFAIQNEREWERFCEIVMGDQTLALTPDSPLMLHAARTAGHLSTHRIPFFRDFAGRFTRDAG